jgi:holin-like protein
MSGALALLLVCQLAGEALHRLTGLPLPGSVIGLGLLLLWLALTRKEPLGLAKISGWLAAHMPLMFVPAAVGLMEEGQLVRQHGLIIVLAMVVSTVLTIGVAAIVFDWAVKRFGTEHQERLADD